VLAGLTIINAALMPDGVIQQSQLRINLTAIGELDGGPSSRCTDIKTALEAGGIQVQIPDNILALMWEKFWTFAGIATIASLSRSRAGVVARAPAGPSLVSSVIAEVTRVVTALGYPPLPAFNAAAQMTAMFAQPDSTYGPSMLIDMEDGRPTEGEHTIGDLADRAARAGINTPLLNAARCNLQAYEINRKHPNNSRTGGAHAEFHLGKRGIALVARVRGNCPSREARPAPILDHSAAPRVRAPASRSSI
jgi:2-dehydropantoate 2-reductase